MINKEAAGTNLFGAVGMPDFMRKWYLIARKKIGGFLRRYAFTPIAADQPWQDFYQRFEDKFRGSIETIETRLKTRYEERLQGIVAKSNAFREGIFLDLGCGRGEMLGIAKRLGYRTLGVDASAAAARRARALGHQAVSGDVLAFLKTQAPESVVAISMLHVIEHMDHKHAWNVFQEAYRILKPGGVFFVETPSLYSLWAAQRQFFLDPTHLRPVHPEFMEFMAKDMGFSNTEILFFDEVQSQERANLAAKASAKMVEEFKKLEKYMYGPMDVALWAIK